MTNKMSTAEKECYNWRNPKEPNSLSMSDVSKTIRFTEIENINAKVFDYLFNQIKISNKL